MATELWLATDGDGSKYLFSEEPYYEELRNMWDSDGYACPVASDFAPAPGAAPVKVVLMPAEPTEQDEALIIQRSCGAEAVELLRATEPSSSIGPVTWWNRLEDILSRHDDAKGKV